MCNVKEEVLKILGDKAMIISMEELAELQQAISKMLRGKDKRNNLIEELIDVSICLEWIIEKYNISTDELCDMHDYKINRMKYRIENNKLRW